MLDHLKKLKSPGKGRKEIIKKPIIKPEIKKRFFDPDVCENLVFMEKSEKKKL